MDPQIRSWFDRRTSRSDAWPVDRCLALKGDQRISVVLPALDEERTVGQIVGTLRSALMVEVPLVDEIVVMDSGSADATAQVAHAAGARVVHRDDVLPHLPSRPGKGEVMWRSLACTDGDIVVFIDADLEDVPPSYVTGLVGPLLADPSLELVKGFYDRPLRNGGPVGADADGGGRVTELVARPLLNLHWPQLAGVVQPLAGEYAARRRLLESLPFPCGYGVELGLLVDTLRVAGLDAIGQVDLGRRLHRHQDVRALGRMAAEIWQVALDRLDRDGRIVLVHEPSTRLTQFAGGLDAGDAATHDVTLEQRPPMAQVRSHAAEPTPDPA